MTRRRSGILKEIDWLVLEFQVCSFLDNKSLLSLATSCKAFYDLVMIQSDVIWSRALLSEAASSRRWAESMEINDLTNAVSSEVADKKADYSGVAELYDRLVNKLFQGAKKITTTEESDLDGELVADTNAHPHTFMYRLFHQYAFDTTGFMPGMNRQIRDKKYNSRELETCNSLIQFSNQNHTMDVLHRFLRGDWETCIARKELLNGHRYYWCVHLTRYCPGEHSNAWTVLIGVDNLKNVPRSNSTSSMHYWLGSQNSAGFGYTVFSSDKYQGSTSYQASEDNKQGDIIGVEYSHINDNAEMTFYLMNGTKKVTYSYENNRKGGDGHFHPAVSAVGGVIVSIFPWDGDVANLHK